MTFEEYCSAVANIAGGLASCATMEDRRYTTGAGELRWTAWIQTGPRTPGVLVDGADPESTLAQLRERTGTDS